MSGSAAPTLRTGQVVAERFRVVRFIASGGMGEVYEVEDVELGARVALKVLRPGLVSRPEVLERLRREVNLARQVTHRNVCRIFDLVSHELVDADGSRRALLGLTMELLRGETLADRLEREGPMTVAAALPFARQVAAALDAAHSSGVIHRDLKASNVMLEPVGDGELRVVVTDFGVARTTPRVASSDPALTTADRLVGTVDYMSPEQAQGREVTRASDLYSYGVLLYEMVTGVRPHAADTPVGVLVRRLREPPPSPRDLVSDLDESWDRAIVRCLALDPARRFETAHAVVAALEGRPAAVDPDAVTVDTYGVGVRRWPSLRAWVLAVGGSVVVAVLVLGALSLRRSPPPPTLVPRQLTTWPGLEIDPAFAPGGRLIAFSANRTGSFEIYVLQLTPGSREMQLTGGNEDAFQPAWSPDGQWIAYASHRRGGIWVVPALGGTSRRLTDVGSHPAWSPDGSRIAFQTDTTAELSANAVHASPPSTIQVVAVAGGNPQPLTRPGEPVGGHGAPVWTPDGRRVVFTASDRRWSQIWSLAVAGGDVRPLVTDPTVAFDPRVAADGRWLYFSAVAEGERYGVWKTPFDPGSGERTGEPVSVVSPGAASARRFTVSEDGRQMVYSALTTVSNLWSLPVSATDDRARSAPVPLTLGSARCSRPAFSPDGTTLAFDRWQVGSSQDIWIMPAAGGEPQQLTVDPAMDSGASWLPDGSGVVFLSDRGGRLGLWSQELASGTARQLSLLPTTADMVRLSPDGQRIAYHQTDRGSTNLWVASLDGSDACQLTFDAELMGYPCWSPDGRWLAFETKRGEEDHVMLIAAAGGDPVQLTAEPGKSWPSSWSPDGRKVVFAGLRQGRWNLYAVDRDSREVVQLSDLSLLGVYLRYPAWSPRGDQVVFERAETTGDLWLAERAQ